MTADIDLVETAKTAAYFRSDGLIITGSSTGMSTNPDEIKAVKAACTLPILVGSGITIENVDTYLAIADALIIGSWFKQNGHWASDLDLERIKRMMERVESRRAV